MADELVKKKLELLGVQKAKADRLNELLDGASKLVFVVEVVVATPPSRFLCHPTATHDHPSSPSPAVEVLLMLCVTHSDDAGPGGFNDASRKTCKNLQVAITTSKQPGYFTYYEQPDHLAAVVRSGEIERLRGQLAQLQKQIDQLSDKIEALHSGAERESAGAGAGGGGGSASVHSLKQWFTAYGSPSKQAAGATAELYTSFTPDKKVYGGTTHYSAFRSQASTMKKGRLTR